MNAVITWLDEPVAAKLHRPARREAAAGQGSHRHGRDQDDLRLGPLRRARPHQGRDRRHPRTRGRRGDDRQGPPSRSSPGACSARTSATAPATTRCIRAGRPGARRAGTRPRLPPASVTWRSAPTRDARSGCRPPAATSSGSSPNGARRRSMGSSRSSRASTRSGRWRAPSRTPPRSGRCISETPVPEPRLAGLTIGLLRQSPGIGDGRTTERSDAAEEWVPILEGLGARVVEATIPGCDLGHLAGVPARSRALTRGHVPRRAPTSTGT